jgi:CRISPR-associated protein Csm3
MNGRSGGLVKLVRIEEIKGTLRVLESGLRIGGSSDTAGIGETDNPVIRNPITKLPYVPGSSVKGKLRTLLELKHSAKTKESGSPCDCGNCRICTLFGTASNKPDHKTPTRLLFRDCQPNEKTLEEWDKARQETDIKTEVLIDRKTGAASGRIGPRTTERITAGSEFVFLLSIRVFEGDNRAELFDFLAEGFELLSKDYLGGYGSRGYGHVAFIAENGSLLSDYLRQEAKKSGKAS